MAVRNSLVMMSPCASMHAYKSSTNVRATYQDAGRCCSCSTVSMLGNSAMMLAHEVLIADAMVAATI